MENYFKYAQNYFLVLPNGTTAPFWKLSSSILGRSCLFGKGCERVLYILGAFVLVCPHVVLWESPVEEFPVGGHPSRQLILIVFRRRDLGYRGSPLWRFLATSGTTSPTPHAAAVEAPALPSAHAPAHARPLLGLLLHLLPCFLFLAAAFLRSMLSIQIPRVVWNSAAILTIRADVGVDCSYSRSVRKANRNKPGYSKSIRPIREGFGKCSESVRCDLKRNEPLELHSERIHAEGKTTSLFVRVILNKNKNMYIVETVGSIYCSV